jgi:hypothetical protein
VTSDEVRRLAAELLPHEVLMAIRAVMQLNPTVRAEVEAALNRWKFEQQRVGERGDPGLEAER